MSKKNVRAKPAKRKSAIRKAKLVSAAPPLFAHRRLVHGFLIRLPKVRLGNTGSVRPASMVAARAGPRATLPVDVRHEGPADDATFH